jgi:Asp-tRNA(Asn)/Glu-tRNA(Gln) amidotransferase B subunit
MAELPVAKRERYLSLGLPKADVLILADELSTADFFDAAMAAGAPAKAAANWIMGDIMAACKVRKWQHVASRSFSSIVSDDTDASTGSSQLDDRRIMAACRCASRLHTIA